MRDLLNRLNETLDRGQPCVYCAVVETRGSTPQKPGAVMLVYPDGSQMGTLGGGCVEAEVKRQALSTLTEDGPADPRILTFNLDDNYGWDDGLICGGRMTILADPLPAGRRAGHAAGVETRSDEATRYYHTLRTMIETGQGGTEAIVVSGEAAGAVAAPPGSRYLFAETGAVAAALGPAAAAPAIGERLKPLASRPRPWLTHGVSYLPILPRVTLLIVGGGHVGQAVAQLASQVDFDIWVLDDRAAYTSAERFPTAMRRLTGDIGQTLRELATSLTPSVYALIVTRGHAHDEEALYHLAETKAGYVGMIGSKRKIKLIYEDLVARGISAETLARVHAPLGFAIGSQTVPEIAISIVAELIAQRNLGATIAAARTQVKL